MFVKITGQARLKVFLITLWIFMSGAGPLAAKSIDFSLRETVPIPEDLFLVDIKDTDGDKLTNMVLIHKDSEPEIVILEKDQNEFKENFIIRENSAIRRATIADIDHDGLPEIISANENHEVNIWKALKNDLYVLIHTEKIGLRIDDLSAYDTDGDGFKELLITTESKPSHVYVLKGTGNNLFKRTAEYSSRGGNTHVIGVADLDNDGLLETVFADDDFYKSGGRIYVYENGKLVYQYDKMAFFGMISFTICLGNTDGGQFGEIIGMDKVTLNLKILKSTGKDNNFTAVYMAPSEYAPMVIDFDNDGVDEFLGFAKDIYGQKNILRVASKNENTFDELYNSGDLFLPFKGVFNDVKLIEDTNGDGHLELAISQGAQIHILEILSDDSSGSSPK